VLAQAANGDQHGRSCENRGKSGIGRRFGSCSARRSKKSTFFLPCCHRYLGGRAHAQQPVPAALELSDSPALPAPETAVLGR
jgi:hypothetical protein